MHTALAMGSWFLLWVDFGPRTQDTAATLIAQVVARAQAAPPLSHGRLEGLYRGAAPGGGRGVSAPASWESGPQAQTTAWWHRKTCSTPKWSRSATRRATSWRSAGAWSSVAHAVLASSCACASSARRSRPPLWNAGMAPCVGWWRPCGAAPGVCPGAPPATGDGSGCMVSLYNFVMPHKSLRQGRTPAYPSDGHRADRPCLELSGVYLAAGAYRSSPHQADGRTDCTAADPGSPGPASWQDTSTTSWRGDRRARKRDSPSAESRVRCSLLFSRTAARSGPARRVCGWGVVTGRPRRHAARRRVCRHSDSAQGRE